MRKKSGFTLVELLVVISIIALLMAMLLPSLSRARELAQGVSCKSKLRTWGISFSMYAADNNGKLWAWNTDLDPGWRSLAHKKYYVSEKLMFCPTATKSFEDCGGQSAVSAWGLPDQPPQGSYGANYWTNSSDIGPQGFNMNLAWRHINMRGIKDAPLLGDCWAQGALMTTIDQPPTFEGDVFTSGSGDDLRRFCINRHRGKIQLVFLDLAVRPISLRGLWDLQWHTAWENLMTEPLWPIWMKGMVLD